MLLLNLILFIIAFMIIIKGASYFIDSAIWIANKTGIPQVIIGATIVSLATTLPEMSVSFYAAISEHTQITLGNIIGSNIFNIAVIIGVLLVFSNINKGEILQKNILLMIVLTIIMIFLAFDGVLDTFNGILLLLFFLNYLFWGVFPFFSKGKRGQTKNVKGSVLVNILKFIGGSTMVILGSRLVVKITIYLANYFLVPEIFISLTLIALGTSLPELITAISAIYKGYQDLSIGNIIGANLFNLGLVISGSSIINNIEISRHNLFFDFPVMLGLMLLLLLVFSLKNKKITSLIGLSFFFIYLGYIYLTFKKI